MNRVLSLVNNGLRTTETKEIINLFLDYYQHHLGDNMLNRLKLKKSIISLGKVITEEHKLMLEADYNASEVKTVVFGIPGMKAPGPYGYNSYFFSG